ncbi:hypothetical protein TRFO_08861 [Tritrichomonas foetus]|uniref:Importin N-terminal domain-containing protein n=1 Tax=Tritrichomonas foetus TaxID=1144522 RepID=A0A1J4JJ01_9EUKA|nr:hypothetical protein TRFO_08861 [Tritrichomonas foetus]|eukprot:OHS98569.1 hypothetical protein TRFO_08861 [Tritrichomonas foetus]
MSDLSQVIIQCYQGLSDPTGRYVQEATNKLMEIYSNPASFQVIVNIILANELPEKLLNYCVVGCCTIINNFYPKAADNDQASMFTSLLQLRVFPHSAYVRNYVHDFVQNTMKFEFLPIVQQFIQTCQQNSTDIEIEAALYVLTMAITYQEDPTQLLPISLPIIETGLNSSSNDTQLAAVLHGINIANLIPQDENGQALLSRFIEYAMKLLITYASSNDQGLYKSLCDLTKNLSYIADQGAEGINYQQILQTCLTLLSNQNIATPFRTQVQVLSDVIIINIVEEISEQPQILTAIFQVYFQFAQSIFIAQDSFDLSGHNVFSTICVEFSEYPDVLELIWQMAGSVSQTPQGRFAAIVALYYSLSGGSDFFAPRLTDLAQLFSAGILDSANCTCEAAALAISELAASQKTKIKLVSDQLIGVILNRLSSDPERPELVNCLNSIVRSAQDIGNVFTNIFEALRQLLQIENDALRLSIFNCLYSLVKYSPKKARHYFKPIFDICQAVLSSNDYSSEQLKGQAISVLSNLMESSTKEFMPFVPHFVQLVVQNLQSSDPSIIYESVTAFGHLLQNYSDQIKQTISVVFPKLIEFSSRDISQQESEQEIFTGNDEDEDFDSKVEPIINVVVSSIRVSCCALSTYPDIIHSNIESVLGVIQKQLNVGDSDCSLGCSQGCVFLVEAFTKLGFNQETQPFLTNLVKLLTQVASSDVSGPDAAGSAFTAISDVIAGDEQIGILCCLPSLDGILGAIQAVFSGSMLYQANKIKFIDTLHVPAMRVIREIIAAMKVSSIKVIQPFVAQFNGLIVHKNNEMRDLMLQFFGDLVYWASEGLDDELKGNTFILALDAAEKRSSAIAFGCFKQLAVKAPHIIQGQLNKVLPLIKAQLEATQTKTDEFMAIQDNAVSALGMIAIHIMKDAFPLNTFLLPALSCLPAQIEAEENNDHIEFFFWLLQRANNQANMPHFAAVAIRLFSDPLDQLEDYCVSPENIQKMLQVLKNFARVPNFEQLCNQVCDGDEFKIENVIEALNS